MKIYYIQDISYHYTHRKEESFPDPDLYSMVGVLHSQSPEDAYFRLQAIDAPLPPPFTEYRSMSCGDIVELNEEYFYCDSVGFKEIPEGDLTKALGKKPLTSASKFLRLCTSGAGQKTL